MDVLAACPARGAGKGRAASSQRRVRGALTARGTRRKPIPGARWRHPCRHTVPQPARTPHQTVGRCSSEKLSLVRRASDLEPMLHDRAKGASSTALAMHTDPLHWPLPAHRRGTLSGMDAAPEPTGTYLRRVPRWWAGKGPAAKPQSTHSAPDAFPRSITHQDRGALQRRLRPLGGGHRRFVSRSQTLATSLITLEKSSAPLPAWRFIAYRLRASSPSGIDTPACTADSATSPRSLSIRSLPNPPL